MVTIQLTEMMYAMAKKVASPARTSVKKKDPLRDMCCMKAISLRVYAHNQE